MMRLEKKTIEFGSNHPSTNPNAEKKKEVTKNFVTGGILA